MIYLNTQKTGKIFPPASKTLARLAIPAIKIVTPAMSEHKIFINRRKGKDRRVDEDPCRDLPVDIYHRKRRKSPERRSPNRNLVDDYSAFYGRTKESPKIDSVSASKLLN